jgi:hypothetical protein
MTLADKVRKITEKAHGKHKKEREAVAYIMSLIYSHARNGENCVSGLIKHLDLADFSYVKAYFIEQGFKVEMTEGIYGQRYHIKW